MPAGKIFGPLHSNDYCYYWNLPLMCPVQCPDVMIGAAAPLLVKVMHCALFAHAPRASMQAQWSPASTPAQPPMQVLVQTGT